MDSFSTTTSFHRHQLFFSPSLAKHQLYPKPRALRIPLRSHSKSKPFTIISVKAASSSESKSHFIARRIKTIAAGAFILSAATISALSGRLPLAMADATTPPPLSLVLESNSEAVEALRSIVYKKLEKGEDEEALPILRRLLEAQPLEMEWKFLASRLLNELGQTGEARKLLEEILAIDPFSFDALFQYIILMNRCDEGAAALEHLERSLELALVEGKKDAARDVRLMIAQMLYLQKNVEAALSAYDALAREDPKDCRPVFCQGVIYSVLEKDKEALEKFAIYNKLTQGNTEMNAYLQTPLSRLKLFGTDDDLKMERRVSH